MPRHSAGMSRNSSKKLPYFSIVYAHGDTVVFYPRSRIVPAVPLFPSHGYVRCGNNKLYLEGIISRVVEYQETRLVLAITLHGCMHELWVAVEYRNIRMNTWQRWNWLMRRGLRCLKEDTDQPHLTKLVVPPTSPLIRSSEEGGYFRQRFGAASTGADQPCPQATVLHPLPPCTHFSRLVYTLERDSCKSLNGFSLKRNTLNSQNRIQCIS